MNDPYQVLGVSPNASTDEVKAAYRELAKKYHPDSYSDNPLSDLASEKMKEINEAYDTIMKIRESGGSQGSSYGYDWRPGSGQGSSEYRQIRELITFGRLDEAKRALDEVPVASRDAEWHFLMGSVMYSSGWANEAYVNFQRAVSMDPGNLEYRQALDQLSRQMSGGFYQNPNFGGYNPGRPGQCTGCDICTGLICADCLCNGCGGC
jgi:molecular chaperone DnaJ